MFTDVPETPKENHILYFTSICYLIANSCAICGVLQFFVFQIGLYATPYIHTNACIVRARHIRSSHDFGLQVPFVNQTEFNRSHHVSVDLGNFRKEFLRGKSNKQSIAILEMYFKILDNVEKTS